MCKGTITVFVAALLSFGAIAEDADTLATIEQGLQSKDTTARINACAAILKLKNPPATLIPQIAASLRAQTPEEQLRRMGRLWAAAMEAAAESHTTELLKLLANKEDWPLVLWALGALKPVDALPEILEFCKRDDIEMRVFCLQLIKAIADENTASARSVERTRSDADRAKLRAALRPFQPFVVSMLNEGREELYLPAADAIRYLHTTDAAVATRLANLVRAHGYDPWSSISVALAAMGDHAAPALPILQEALKSQNERARENAVQCISHSAFLAKAALAQMLATVSDDPHEDARWFAVQALEKGGVETPEVVHTLAKALSDHGEERKVCSSAAIALARMKRPPVEALDELIVTCETIDPREKFQYTSQSEARRWAAKALGNIGADASKAVPALAALLLTDKSPYVRYHVVEALGKMRSHARETLPNLLQAAQRADAADFERVEIEKAIKAIQVSDNTRK